MARIARIVVPGLPHHITQRCNRREQVFFEDGDYQLCGRAKKQAGLRVKKSE